MPINLILPCNHVQLLSSLFLTRIVVLDTAWQLACLAFLNSLELEVHLRKCVGHEQSRVVVASGRALPLLEDMKGLLLRPSSLASTRVGRPVCNENSQAEWTICGTVCELTEEQKL